MRYVIIAILLYFAYLFIRRFLRNLAAQNKSQQNNRNSNKDNTSQKKSYDVNMIQDAEFREVKKD